MAPLKLFTHRRKKYSGTSLLESVIRREIPIEWELVKHVYSDQPWVNFYRCNRMGDVFLYTHPDITSRDKSFSRLLSYLDSYRYSFVGSLEDWGSDATLEKSAEIFGMFDFKSSKLTTDFVVYHGRTYLINMYSLDCDRREWMDKKGIMHIENKMPGTVIVYARSISSDLEVNINSNYARMDNNQFHAGMGSCPNHQTIDVKNNCNGKLCGVMNRYKTLDTDELHDLAASEWDNKTDKCIRIHSLENIPTGENGYISKSLFRLFMSVGKVWGLEPCKLQFV